MEKKRSIDLYKNIIDMPYEKSKTRDHMSNHDRAAQFSPFAALTGYDAIIKESARRTDGLIVLSEGEKERINRELTLILDNTYMLPRAEVTFFVPDEKKEGGKYVTRSIKVKRIDTFDRVIISDKGERIRIDLIKSVRSDLSPDMREQ